MGGILFQQLLSHSNKIFQTYICYYFVSNFTSLLLSHFLETVLFVFTFFNSFLLIIKGIKDFFPIFDK